jgi:hypothetical protein
MFSNKTYLISSTLSSLQLSELLILKEMIDVAIAKNPTNIMPKLRSETWISTNLYEAFIRFNRLENQIKFQENILQELQSNEGVVSNSDVVTYEPAGVKEFTSTQKTSRRLGIWKGQVEVSDDFYKTSSDIISEFGIDK